MLPRAERLVSSTDFADTVRRGRRIGRSTVVLHARPAATTRVGFVVSKAVGGAVVRNRVKRRLRHLVAAELTETRGYSGVQVVVRALPAAATEPDRLPADLRSAWAKLGARS